MRDGCARAGTFVGGSKERMAIRLGSAYPAPDIIRAGTGERYRKKSLWNRQRGEAEGDERP
jgi:hypothetical protein